MYYGYTPETESQTVTLSEEEKDNKRQYSSINGTSSSLNTTVEEYLKLLQKLKLSAYRLLLVNHFILDNVFRNCLQRQAETISWV